MEDHDGALSAWRAAGCRDRVLCHFDAHIDFSLIAPPAVSLLEQDSLAAALETAAAAPLWDLGGKSAAERVHLGNFIHEAIREGIVAEFRWIYPDGPDAAAQTRAVARILRATARQNPEQFRIEESGPGGIFRGTLYGRPFQALPLAALRTSPVDAPVLLDVDVDFFVISDLGAPHYPLHDPARPCWRLSPERFLAEIAASGLSFDLATVSYSVEEGYTPAELKFLGDELAARLDGSLTPDREALFALLRRVHGPTALPLEHRIALLESFAGESAAALDFSLALLLARRGELALARRRYERAVGSDPSYRTRYNHAGPVLAELGCAREAEESYALMSRLDPEHPGCRLFELQGRLARRDWDGAVALGDRLFSEGAREPELPLALAQAHLGLGQHGRGWQWTALCEPARLPPPLQRRYWALRAEAAEGLGRRDEALSCWQGFLRCSTRAPRAHLALARLYLRRGNLYKARRHAWKAFRQRER
jgi:tetratricopeptide (TPR) repeat protein